MNLSGGWERRSLLLPASQCDCERRSVFGRGVDVMEPPCSVAISRATYSPSPRLVLRSPGRRRHCWIAARAAGRFHATRCAELPDRGCSLPRGYFRIRLRHALAPAPARRAVFGGVDQEVREQLMQPHAVEHASSSPSRLSRTASREMSNSRPRSPSDTPRPCPFARA